MAGKTGLGLGGHLELRPGRTRRVDAVAGHAADVAALVHAAGNIGLVALVVALEAGRVEVLGGELLQRRAGHVVAFDLPVHVFRRFGGVVAGHAALLERGMRRVLHARRRGVVTGQTGRGVDDGRR